MEINTWFLMILLMKIKHYQKKYTDVWGGIKNETKATNGVKENNYKNITWKLNLILMVTCH